MLHRIIEMWLENDISAPVADASCDKTQNPVCAILSQNALVSWTEVGVLVSSDLRPRNQCMQAKSRANRVLGFITRSVSNRSADVMLKLYLALVRPHLDYAV